MQSHAGAQSRSCRWSSRTRILFRGRVSRTAKYHGIARPVLPALELSEITHTYGASSSIFRRSEIHTALRGVSLDIRPGELFGVLGENGAGKTTLVKIGSTLLAPTEGSIRLLGEDARRNWRSLRSRINVVLGGDQGLYTRLTGKENLLYFGMLYGYSPSRARERAEESLEFAGLSDAADKRVEDYSRGMKQRLHLARGILNNPEILFLDEPTIGLDVAIAREIRERFRALANRGVTTVLTTHYMHEAEALCDRIAILQRGELRFVGRIDDLLAKVRVKAVVEIILPANADEVPRQIQVLPGVLRVSVERREDRHVVLAYVEDQSEGESAIRKALTEVPQAVLRTRPANLESAYMQVLSESEVT